MNLSKAASVAGGLGVGAGLMYFLDPDRGRRRRALVRDKGASWMCDSRTAINKAARDAANRARGVAHSGKAIFSRGSASDDVVLARVRSRLGRATGHPRALDIAVEKGRVILRGAALKHEVDHLLSEVKSVPGVTDVDNRLEIYRHEGDVPSLQGGGHVSRPGRGWAPGVRLLAGGAGAAMAALGLPKGSAAGYAAAALGAGLMARAITGRPRNGAGRGGVEIQKTLNVLAPVDEVYRFWTNYRNFPRFMSHLKHVEDLGDGRSHWTASGPAGIPVSWDAEITQSEPNRLMAWRSAPGSAVENEGVVRFDEGPEGGTRVTVRMSYHPPAGALGHAVASLFGADPKRELDDDLLRLKSLLEFGKTRAHGHTVHREAF